MAIQKITDGEIKSTLATDDKAIVKFYADWCGSCKLIAPKYRRLSEDERYGGVSFYEVNAEENETIRKEAGVDNLPFFAVYRDGKLVEGSATSKVENIENLLAKLS